MPVCAGAGAHALQCWVHVGMQLHSCAGPLKLLLFRGLIGYMQIGANFKGMSKGIKAHKRAERMETVAPQLEQALHTGWAAIISRLCFFHPSVIISTFQKEQNQR